MGTTAPSPLLTGDAYQGLRLTPLVVYEGCVPERGRGYTTFPHHAAWLVRQGRAEVELEDGVTRAERGEWLIPRPVPRWQRFSDDCRILSIRFRARWAESRNLLGEIPSSVLRAEACPKLQRSAERLVRLYRRNLLTGAGAELLSRELSMTQHIEIHREFLRFFRELLAALRVIGVEPLGQTVSDPRVTAALRMIQSRGPSQPIHVAEVARHAGLSVSQLERLFSEQVRQSPKDVITRTRMLHARDQLAHSRKPMKQIAAEMGFSHLGGFSAWFRKHVGQSPSQYRREGVGQSPM